MRWSYGVTTTKARLDTLLPRTLESLKAAGFGEPWLFADGVTNAEAVDLEKRLGLYVAAHHPALRTHGRWLTALHLLYLMEPDAERYFLSQDDVLYCRNVRPYLERLPYPNDGKAYCSLFAFRENEALVKGKVGWVEAAELSSGHVYHGKKQQAGRGAVALVFNREACMALLSARHMVERYQDRHRGWKRVDGGIVESLNKEGFREFCHAPSLTFHLGQESTIGNHGQRQALTFPGEDFDALSLLPEAARA